MPPQSGASAGTHIPGERQSSRLRARTSVNALSERAGIKANTRSTRSVHHSHSQSQARATADLRQDDAEDPEKDDDDDEDAGESDDHDTVFKRRARLPESSVQRWKLSEVVQKIDNGLIDLNPDYQREVVWKASAMTSLIDSLIDDYYIPPIIFNLKVSRRSDGSEKYHRVCVDGKQRLSSVHAFMKGEIPCTDKHKRPWYYCEPLDADGQIIPRGNKHRKRRVWTEEDRKLFRNKSFVSYEFKELDKIQEEDLFARVQKGVALNAAEKLQASSGPWQDVAKRFEQQFRDVVCLSKGARGMAFKNVMTSFSQIIENRYPSNVNNRPGVKLQTPSVIAFVNKRQNLCSADNIRHLEDVFAKFSELARISLKTFQDNNYKVAKNFAPVELVAVAVLLSTYIDSRNTVMLLGDIEAMRETIREHLPDLRMDNVTWKTIRQYIDELESFRGAADNTTVRKKNFIPRRVTDYEKSRIKPAAQEVLPYQTSSPSAHDSFRSTPATSKTSPTSPEHTRSPTAKDPRSARQRSASFDSVLGTMHDSQDIEMMTAPRLTVPALQQLSTTSHSVQMLVPVIGGSSEPVLKLEGESANYMSRKRSSSIETSGTMKNISAELRAQRAKRVRLSLYPNSAT